MANACRSTRHSLLTQCFSLLLLLFLTPSAALAVPTKEVLEGARKEGKLLLYCSTSTADSAAMLKGFREKYPFIKAEEYRTAPPKLLTKIVMESNFKSYLPDVIQLRIFEMYMLKKKGLLDKYTSPESKNIPSLYKDPDGFFIGMYWYPHIIGYNKRLVAPQDVPRSYDDLLLPKWKGKMALDTDDFIWFAHQLQIMGQEKGVAFMRKLAEQKLQLRSGKTLAVQLLSAGEFSIAVNVYGHRVEEMKKLGAPIDWVGVEPIIAQVQPIALATRVSHPNAARLYIDFVLSDDGQKLVNGLYKVPIRTDIQSQFKAFEKLKLYPTRPELSEHYDELSKLYKDIFGK